RLGVALQGMALGGVAYLHALNYARERIQGVEIQNIKDPNAPRVPIIRHPDIRRMLMKMKAYTEGLRALLYRSALFADLAKASPDPKEREDGLNRIELLTPVCKAYAADVGFRLTEWAIQVFGGYGYCGDYPVEQLCRDVKITSIYEGTNGIQAMDLVGRKLALKKGALFLGWLKEIGEFIERHRAHSVFGPWTSRLEQAKNALVQVTGHFAKTAAEGDRLYPMLQAYPYLELFGDLEVARLLLEQALLSRDRLERAFSQAEATAPEAQARVIAGQSEAAYLHGKIQGAEFFISQILPRVQSTASAILSGDRSALEMPEGAF
ncbi:MAG: acyl-CoA dehydrogenase, partial [Deltaproteobacteria bacterium]|nr:acyl-CoA dehydrogenase [Deltaproteobacteria bacterium]